MIKNPDYGRESRVVFGELRDESVKIGHHEPPGRDKLHAFMARFEEAYAPERHHGVGK